MLTSSSSSSSSPACVSLNVNGSDGNLGKKLVAAGDGAGVVKKKKVGLRLRGKPAAVNTTKHLWAGVVASMVSRTTFAPLERLKLEYMVLHSFFSRSSPQTGLHSGNSKQGRAALFEKLGRPLKTFYILETVRACDIEYDADTYKYLANADPREHMFTVLNPATGLPDEVFTACVIKWKKKEQMEKDCEMDKMMFSFWWLKMMISLYMWCVSGKKSGLPDEVFTACVIKRCREDQCNDLSVAVVAASDDVQGTSVLKRHTCVVDEVLAANVQTYGKVER
ncbi:hypothetical protein Tco_0053757 [Tanacetum coccineum]